jgi:hypothetical protein
MADEIHIRFRGICTHLVNDTPHDCPVEPGEKPPRDIALRPVHGRRPHTPLQHRVFLPSSEDLPPHLHDIPRHYPRLRYQTGDVAVLEEWNPVRAEDGWWEVDLTGIALWFDGVDETGGDSPAQALKDLPSVWMKTCDHRKPNPQPDPNAINHFDRAKAAAYVDFFGGQHLERHGKRDDKRPDEPAINEVTATLRIDGTPTLVWKPFTGPASSTTIRPGAEIQISNMAKLEMPCEERDYLLHYRATKLDLNEEPVPQWKEKDIPPPGPDRPFCSNSTYP